MKFETENFLGQSIFALHFGKNIRLKVGYYFPYRVGTKEMKWHGKEGRLGAVKLHNQPGRKVIQLRVWRFAIAAGKGY